MSELKHLTLDELKQERDSAIKYIAKIEQRISGGEHYPEHWIINYKNKWNGQKERLRWIDLYIEKKELSEGIT